ncbi:hypothetical protein D9M71_809520 [compost metagenome]
MNAASKIEAHNSPKKAGSTVPSTRPNIAIVARLENIAAALNALTDDCSLRARCPIRAMVAEPEANPDAMALRV